MSSPFSRRSVLQLGAATGLVALTGRDPLPAASGQRGTESPATDAGASGPDRPETIFRADLQRTGYWPDRSVPDDVRLDWSVPGINKGDHTAAKSSPLVYGERVIVPGDVGTVFSFGFDGDPDWATALHPSGNGTHSTPVIASGTIYTAGYDGAVYAIDAESGTTRWRTEVSDAIGSSPTYYDGLVYVATEFHDPSGGMAALDAESGEVVWEDNRMTDHAHSITGIDPDHGVFAAGCNDGRLYVWNLDTHTFEGAFETGAAIKGPICLYDGVAVFGSWDDNVYAVSLDTLAEEWRVETDGSVMSGAGIHPDLGAAYIGGHDRRLRAIDLATGEVRWTHRTGGWIIGSPVVTEDTVLVGAYDGTLHAVAADGGDLRWVFDAPDGRVTASPAVHDGNVYVTERAPDGGTGHLYKLVPA